jgi:adenylate cyclase class IV
LLDASVRMRCVNAPRKNIECKASDPDPAGSLAVCRAVDAKDQGEIRQRDTYFAVPHGGLKLREEQPGRPHLIQFERASEPQQRESRYRIAEVDDADALRSALTAAIGTTVVVCKTRRLFLWRHVRIHLDVVEWLGNFIEIEAVAPLGCDLAEEYALVQTLRERLGITDDRLVASGYAEQLRALDPDKAMFAPDATLVEMVEAVRAIPYGRPSDRTVSGMLRERRGTCSTKHLFLARVLAARFPDTEPAVVHRVYTLRRDSASKLFGASVADAIPDDGLVDVHRYLEVTLRGQRVIIDVTFPGPCWDGFSPLPLACGAGTDFPAGDDPDAAKRALEERHCELAIRERFIATLSTLSP